jgi:hypothetical protein
MKTKFLKDLAFYASWLWRNARSSIGDPLATMPASEIAKVFGKPHYPSIVLMKLEKWRTRAAWKQTVKRIALCCICGNPLKSTVGDLLAGPPGLPACVNCRQLAAAAKALEKT